MRNSPFCINRRPQESRTRIDFRTREHESPRKQTQYMYSLSNQALREKSCGHRCMTQGQPTTIGELLERALHDLKNVDCQAPTTAVPSTYLPPWAGGGFSHSAFPTAAATGYAECRGSTSTTRATTTNVQPGLTKRVQVLLEVLVHTSKPSSSSAKVPWPKAADLDELTSSQPRAHLPARLRTFFEDWEKCENPQ